MARLVAKQFALCLENAGNEASLILGKVYRILPDARAAKDDCQGTGAVAGCDEERRR